MYCPQCKAEYCPGFTRCSDCEVDLVEHLAESNDSSVSLSEARTKRVWFCDDQESCVSVCSRLKTAGIPFKVTQRKRQIFWRLDEHYEVWVPPEFYDKAKPIAEQGCSDFSDNDGDQKIMELPAAGPDLDKRDTKNRSSCIEDTTVEVWSGAESKGVAWMVMVSLRENDIDCHIDETRDGLQRILVRPGDELQAREIVREIESGTPPT